MTDEEPRTLPTTLAEEIAALKSIGKRLVAELRRATNAAPDTVTDHELALLDEP